MHEQTVMRRTFRVDGYFPPFL